MSHTFPVSSLFSAVLVGTGLAVSCSALSRENAKDALSVAQITCAIARSESDDAAIAKACDVNDALAPDLRKVLTEHRAASKRKAALAVCPDAGK